MFVDLFLLGLLAIKKTGTPLCLIVVFGDSNITFSCYNRRFSFNFMRRVEHIALLVQNLWKQVVRLS
jgi:hypothetical protein